jgi:pimeloyl-ACP methyl ester carboxylesterase
MSYLAYNEDGTPLNNFRVAGYDNRSVAECTEEEKEEIFSHVPIQSYTDKVGEENLYYYAYNSFGDMYSIVDGLEELIEKAKQDTGKDKVNLLPVSLGGAVSVAYVGEHPQNDDINKIVLIVPAADGSEIIGKIMLGQLDYSDTGLYRNMFTKLVGTDNYTGWLINIALRVLPKSLVIDILKSVASGISDSALSRITTMWGLVPSSMYDELAEKYLVEGTKFADDVEKFHNAQLNYVSNLKAYAASGIKIYDICGYGLELYSLIDSDSNSDKIIHSASTSLGATFSKVNETLPSGYTQQNYTDVNFMSPDGQVDASTCAFPYTTWFFGNQDHEKLARNDVVISLATQLLVVKEMDVFTTVEYPQFNGHRDTKYLTKYLGEAKEVDLSTLSSSDAQKLTSAIQDAEDILATTIIVEGESEAATQNLYDVLVDIGVYEKEDTTVDDALLVIFRTASEMLYRFFGPRGFSDPKAA